MKTFFFTLIAAVLVIDLALASCPKTFKHCICFGKSEIKQEITVIICQNISFVDIQNEFNAAGSNTTNSLFLAPKNGFGNFLKPVTTDELILDCTYITQKLINVDSINIVVKSTLRIKNCDLSQFKWSLLSTMHNITSITITQSSNVHTTFSKFPSLTLQQLSDFNLYDIKDINGFAKHDLFPETLPNSLKHVRIEYCAINDDALENILNRIAISSANTLQSLIIDEANLTMIPPSVFKFNSLAETVLKNNKQPMRIKSNSIKVTKSINVNLRNNQITDIEPGAFQGNYSGVTVILSSNQLTTLSSGTFGTMINQMENSEGYLKLKNNTFNCVNHLCDMAWLIRERKLLKNDGPVRNAKCSNDTLFSDLDQNTLKDPSGNPCP